MIHVSVQTEGDNCWPDLKEKGFIEGQLTSVARLPRGMTSGASSVALRIELPDGRTVIAQTSMEVFQSAASVFRVRDELDKEAH